MINRYPRTLYYLIDVICNERCSKCSHWKYKTQKTIEDTKYLINYLNSIESVKELVIVGGEPLIYKNEIIDILKNISDKVRTTIVTNGVLADENFINELKGTNTHLVFSIDTLNKDFWKFVRGKDTYDRVLRNFHYVLKTLDSTQISVQSVLSKETKTHVEKVGKWLSTLGIYHSIQDYISNGFDGSWTELDNKMIESDVNCKAHKYNMSILPNGDVYTCFQQPLIPNCKEPIGNITENTFQDIIKRDYFKSIIKSMSECNLPCKVLKCNID